GGFSCLEVAVLVYEPNYRISVRYVDPLRIRTWRIEGNAKRLSESTGKDLNLLRLAFGGDSAKYFQLSTAALSEEHIPVRRRAQQPGIVQSSRVLVDFESRGSLWPGIGRTIDQIGSVVHGLAGIRFRQIRQGNFVDHTGSL